MTNLAKVAVVAALVCCLFAAAPVWAQDNNCASLTMLMQGKLDPVKGGWVGQVKGLLVDRNNRIYPLEGALAKPPFPGPWVMPVYTGQVAHETFPFAFDFGPLAGRFTGLIDHEIATYSPSVTPHFEFDPKNPPPFVVGTTKSTFKVDPSAAGGWAGGWFAKATGNISASATFLVNSIPVPPFPVPDHPEIGPIVGYWNVEITGKLCNLDLPK